MGGEDEVCRMQGLRGGEHEHAGRREIWDAVYGGAVFGGAAACRESVLRIIFTMAATGLTSASG